ncbi:MAG: glycosyltransferase family 4 protein [Christensenellaceae bacterium]|jgi:glycosyltransferase involved in cell wall biosynthesis|nr:glycosyltransferase family 4 protein [Christensenellaceae bacterium]
MINNTVLQDNFTGNESTVISNDSIGVDYITNKPNTIKGKVLFVTTTDSMIWHFLQPHIKAMMEDGYIVECACSKTGDYFDNIKAALNITVHKLHFSRRPFKLQNIKAYYELKKLIKTNHYDILHCHEPVGGALCRLAGHKYCKKIIYTAHGFHFFSGNSRFNNFLYGSIERFLALKTDLLITMNNEDFIAAKNFKLRTNDSMICKINGIGINTAIYSNASKSQNTIKEQYNILSNKKIILTVGECISRKNHITLINALQKIDPVAVLVICGGGPLLYKLLKTVGVTISDRIIFTGYQSQMIPFYSEADVFVSSSLQEGLPCSMMEAMASGLPVVASDIRGHVDLIDTNGGILLDPNDDDGFANSINTILKDTALAKEMGEHNMEKIKMFDSTVVIKEMQQLYAKLENVTRI